MCLAGNVIFTVGYPAEWENHSEGTNSILRSLNNEHVTVDTNTNTRFINFCVMDQLPMCAFFSAFIAEYMYLPRSCRPSITTSDIVEHAATNVCDAALKLRDLYNELNTCSLHVKALPLMMVIQCINNASSKDIVVGMEMNNTLDLTEVETLNRVCKDLTCNSSDFVEFNHFSNLFSIALSCLATFASY